MRVLPQILGPVDRGKGNPRPLGQFDQGGGLQPPQAGAQFRQQPGRLDPPLVGGQLRVVRPVCEAEGLAEPLPVAVRGEADEHLAAIRGGEQLVHRPGAGAFRHGPHRFAADGRSGHVLTHEQGHRLEQRGLDQLAPAGLFALAQGGEDADHGQAAAEDVGDRGPGAQRPAARPGHPGQAAEHLHHLVQGLALRIRPGHEPLEGAEDDARVARPALLPADPQPVHRARGEVLDDHVRLRHQVEEQRPAAIALQVDGQALLVAVEAGEKTGAEPRKVAGVVTPTRPLDLPDLGAQVGEDQAADRPHDVVPEFEHTHPGERPGLGRRVRDGHLNRSPRG